MYERKFLNYVTIVVAISTIGMAMYTIKTKENVLVCTIMLIVTLILNFVSNKCSDSYTDLTKKDKEFLKELKEKYKK